jgi:hypothetical protein
MWVMGGPKGDTQEHTQGVEVNLCSLVTAMTDQHADDGVELEASGSYFLQQGHETELEHLTEEQRQELQKLSSRIDIFNDVPGPADFRHYHLDAGQSKPVSQAPYRP